LTPSNIHRLDEARWRRLLASDGAIARDVVRALYVAVLEREPDAQGLSLHTERLARGFPLEALAAQFARARDTERREDDATRERELRSIADAAVSEHVSALQEVILAQRRTLLAVTRRLAVLEDRLQEGPAESKPARSRAARRP
jgi:hypothetical protein